MTIRERVRIPIGHLVVHRTCHCIPACVGITHVAMQWEEERRLTPFYALKVMCTYHKRIRLTAPRRPGLAMLLNIMHDLCNRLAEITV